MALKDNWVDLEDAVDGVPDSGSDITVEPINAIAHAVIENEDDIKDAKDRVTELEKNSGKVDLSNYYTKTEIDDELQNKEDKSNKITFAEWNSSDKKDELLFSDDKYISSLLALTLHEEFNLRLLNDVEQMKNKICAEGEIIATAPYYSVESTQEYVTGQIDKKLGDIESLLGGI